MLRSDAPRVAPAATMGSRRGTLALYLAYGAITARALIEYSQGPALGPAAALLAATLALFVLLPRLAGAAPGGSRLLHGLFLVAAAIVVVLALLPPAPDFMTALLVLLSFRAAQVFTGRSLRAWIAVLIVLVAAPLVYLQGPAWGLALSLSSMAGCVVVPAYFIVSRRIEAARAESEALLAELRQAHEKLRAYSLQVAELAATEEHERLAHELHDSVSQTLFSINLTTGAVRLLLEPDPERARAQLERLQALTQSALADMRGFITQLRPG